MGSAVTVAPAADGIDLGGRALYPGGALLVVLVGIGAHQHRGKLPTSDGGAQKRPSAVLTATRSAPHTRSQCPIRSPVREPGAEEVTA